MARSEPLTEDDVDRIARQVLDHLVDTQPGVPGLRRLGTGATDAAGSGDVAALARVFGARPALPSSVAATSPAELRSFLPHPELPLERTTLMEVRALTPHLPMPMPTPDDAQVVLAQSVFGVR